MVYSDKNYCSESINYKNGTCYRLDDLKLIGKELKIKDYENYTKKTQQKLWNKIKNTLKDCPSEVCWIKHPLLKNLFNKNIRFSNKDNKSLPHSIQFFRFKPTKPDEDGHNTWLSTIDIENLLNQLDKKHKDFKFLGAVPINFDEDIGKVNGFLTNSCVSEDLCKLDIIDLINNGIRKIGIVFNMDPHYKSGTHWTSMFIEIDNKNKNVSIEYFDSFGLSPKNEIKTLIERITTKLSSQYNIINRINKIKFQENNTECGVYSIYYIRERVLGYSFDTFIENLNKIKYKNRFKPDNIMSNLRNVFFIPKELENIKQ